MSGIKKIVYICDRKINFEVLDLLIDSKMYSQIEAYVICEDKIKKKYTYKSVNVKTVNKILECQIDSTKKIVLDFKNKKKYKLPATINLENVIFIDEKGTSKSIKKIEYQLFLYRVLHHIKKI